MYTHMYTCTYKTFSHDINICMYRRHWVTVTQTRAREYFTYIRINMQHTCITLQHTATHCNTLQHTATHCNTLQHTAAHCNACLPYTPPSSSADQALCNTLQHTATRCNTPQHAVTHCNTLQHAATQSNILQHSTTHCTTVQHTATPVTQPSSSATAKEAVSVRVWGAYSGS